ncbi:NAD(P)-dependent oxidoreductase [Sphingomonas sp. NBWT7]|uniref:SDR family oxidoreductase n=1 Tax=Sphingomonas sp. NBWT7 TaxID=2596913 RepID=UPI0016268B35|nr:NAD(P)-dependent oxidoreductase [Sphingomonas sp. NBWT7]QNE32997.1 NAD(P)-dependent oxidoreductase [Sphingomonas sp. NBWT7]
MGSLERWCGVECTVSRTGDVYTDQLRRSGHHDRPADIARIAALGFSAIRYPILWERVSPDSPDTADWTWCDARLAALRDANIRVIGGLIHHGSGPAYTTLLADDFATGLARHAAGAAARYPWITDWTPVNEPTTTARFAALYGHWYPHARDEASFWLALLNQIDAVRLSMRAIRAVIPSARLIQTDDLGRTWGTRPLAEQAAFDNQRRWAGWDLLCGKVTANHPLWHRLCAFGFARRLRTIAADPCPPDVIGINHYPTSDRFLDHRVQRYPADVRGGNGRRIFADVPAIRALEPGPAPFSGAMHEAWERYGLPIALTEVHLGCTREEQMRWADEALRSALAARAAGVDVRAITAWSMFGCSDWDTLITRPGRYEPGLFNVAGGFVRETALARQWRGAKQAHDVVAQPGWWRRPERLIFAAAPRPARSAELRDTSIGTPQPLLICGATGTLGQAIARACIARGIAFRLTTRAECDLGDPLSIATALDDMQPWAVVNAAGWVRVDEAETQEAACWRSNATGAIDLAIAAAEREVPIVALSSDLVFDGAINRPYVESDMPRPLSAYGRSKQAMEDGVIRRGHRPLVVRAAAFFSPDDPYNFAHAVARDLDAGRQVGAADDQIVSPSYVPRLVDTILDLLIDGEDGIRHLVTDGAVTWLEFGRAIARAIGHDPDRIVGVSGADLGWRAPRPRYSVMASEHIAPLASLAESIDHFADRWRSDHPALGQK